MQHGSRDSKPGVGAKNLTPKQLGPGDDLAMLNDPGLWPRWPFLPVKRWRDGVLTTGIVFASKPLRFAGNDANVWAPPKDDAAWTETTAEALLADGWIVD